MKVIDELKWVSELNDIDHDICDTARDAIEVIERMKKSLQEIRKATCSWGWKDDIIKQCIESSKKGLAVVENERRKKALDELTEQAQDLDMGY